MLSKSFGLVCLLAWSATAVPQDAILGDVATVGEARAVVDLSVGPLIAASGEPQLAVASQSFEAKGTIVDVATKIDHELATRGFQKLDGAMFTEAYASASYAKAAFNFSLMVMPSGTPEMASVRFVNHGNVDLKKLPKPAGTTELFVQPATAIFLSGLSIDEAKSKARQLLEDDGWQWFGDTTVSFFVRKNAVRLQVMCSESPAQQGKTTLHFSSELLSSALPTVADLVRIGYSDATMCLDGDSKLPPEEFVAAYREALSAEGWKATTEQPIKIDFREHLIFRNEQNELAELAFHSIDALTRFELTFMTAAQVEKENELAKLAASEANAKRIAAEERMKNPPKIAITQPDTATLTEAGKQLLEFRVRSGTAQNVVAKWLRMQAENGWVSETKVDTREVGEFELRKGEMVCSVSFVDPGFVPGEIDIRTSSQFQLEISE